MQFHGFKGSGEFMKAFYPAFYPEPHVEFSIVLDWIKVLCLQAGRVTLVLGLPSKRAVAKKYLLECGEFS